MRRWKPARPTTRRATRVTRPGFKAPQRLLGPESPLQLPPGQQIKIDITTDLTQWIVAIGTPLTILTTVAAIWFTQRTDQQEARLTRHQVELTRQGQITDRFTAAVDHLGSDKIDARIGGAYALQRIMRDSDSDRAAVIHVLSAYMRTHFPAGEGDKPKPEAAAVDAQAVMDILINRPAPGSPPYLDLSGADLAYLDLPDATLNRANLSNADLSGVVLNGADLARANLRGANISAASLQAADLAKADLTRADMSTANLTAATATEAWLFETDLSQANLYSADLTGARLMYTTFTGADLTYAKLKDSVLHEAGLADATTVGVRYGETCGHITTRPC